MAPRTRKAKEYANGCGSPTHKATKQIWVDTEPNGSGVEYYRKSRVGHPGPVPWNIGTSRETQDDARRDTSHGWICVPSARGQIDLHRPSQGTNKQIKALLPPEQVMRTQLTCGPGGEREREGGDVDPGAGGTGIVGIVSAWRASRNGEPSIRVEYYKYTPLGTPRPGVRSHHPPFVFHCQFPQGPIAERSVRPSVRRRRRSGRHCRPQ